MSATKLKPADAARRLKRASDRVKERILKAFEDTAKELHRLAVEEWDATSSVGTMKDGNTFRTELTGSTRLGFTAALFYHKKLEKMYRANRDSKMSKMTMAGNSEMWDFGSGEWIGSKGDTDKVYRYADPNYSFIEVPRKWADDYAKELLSSYSPKDGYHIVVFDSVPYAEFLATRRHLNILTQTTEYACSVFMKNMSKLNFNNLI